MKEIMSKESSSSEKGVPAFEYSPATKYQPLLFELSRPLDDLENILLNNFAGQKIKMIDIYNQHYVDKPYFKKNYKDILIKLEAERQITANPSKGRKNSFGNTVEVIFP
jgi:hypothetical protein